MSIYQLRSWIPLEKLNFDLLCFNNSDGLMSILERFPEKINWTNLSMNPNDRVVDFLFSNKDKLDWHALALNKNIRIVRLLQRNMEKLDCRGICKVSAKSKNINYKYGICFKCLSKNPSNSAINYLRNFQYEIDWEFLSMNPSDLAIDLLESNVDLIDWFEICFNSNPRILNLFNRFPEKINWDVICLNKHDFMCTFVSQNVEKITTKGWNNLSSNNCDIAISILENNRESINHDYLSLNKNPKIGSLIKFEKLEKPNFSRNPHCMETIKSNYKFVNLNELSCNPGAVPFLFYHQNDIYWDSLSSNRGIFVKKYWKIYIKPLVRILSIHKQAVISANHPFKKLKRGEFDFCD